MEGCLSMEGSCETGQLHRPFQVFIVHPCNKFRNGMCRIISIFFVIINFECSLHNKDSHSKLHVIE